MKKSREKKIFSGSANPTLAAKIAEKLNLKLGSMTIRRFSDGEIWVKYNENIRGADVFIIQSTNSPAENLLELLIMIDAARRASAARITAVIPYFGYARQDRKDQPRVPISAKLIANLITVAGADRVLTMDLHAPQIQGFFDIPFDHLYCSYVFMNYFRKKKIPNLVVMAPDLGGIGMARAYAKRLKAELALAYKRREEQNKVAEMEIMGNVHHKNVLIVDDMIDTGRTLIRAVQRLKEEKLGARDIYVACTHALLNDEAVQRIDQAPIKEIVVSDSVLIPPEKQISKLKILSVDSLFAQAINCIHEEKSISVLFDIVK
ncbi:ribose-phosphate diphosphokinase [candidate division KSB1 bacterium]|nr:MAG: ribose-phosphate pyrophosphokinase [candidate division KSB1 bacterium 4484_219]RKY79293.1 MAG: ribose-phosphate diphosphokinase [candidate division KSB1 bacterium]